MAKIESIDPPEKAVLLEKYPEEKMSQKQAMKISQKLREVYAKYLNTRNFGEMENAILTYDSARNLAIVDKQIVGAISFHQNELSGNIHVDHVGTLMSPKGTGAELVRTVVDLAYKGQWGMVLESTYEAMDFWNRLGFKRNKKVPYIFEVDFKRVNEIKEALGTIGRVKTEKNGVLKMKIEEITKEALSKAPDKDLKFLRYRFTKIWDKNFKDNEKVIAGDFERNDFIAKYRLLLKESQSRSLQHSTDDIDKEAFKKAMVIAKTGLDVSQFEALVEVENFIFVEKDFAEKEEIQITIQSETEIRNESLEVEIAEIFKVQSDKTCIFVYERNFSGEAIPLFHRVLQPVKKMIKTEIVNEDKEQNESELEMKFEKDDVPLIPIEKGDEQIVYGIVYEPDSTDSQGDAASAKEIRKAAYQFMEEVQIFKVNHKGKEVAVKVLENYLAPVSFSIGKKKVKKGSWVLVTRVLDKKIWEDIKKGDLTGYSMAGYARVS